MELRSGCGGGVVLDELYVGDGSVRALEILLVVEICGGSARDGPGGSGGAPRHQKEMVVVGNKFGEIG